MTAQLQRENLSCLWARCRTITAIYTPTAVNNPAWSFTEVEVCHATHIREAEAQCTTTIMETEAYCATDIREAEFHCVDHAHSTQQLHAEGMQCLGMEAMEEEPLLPSHLWSGTTGLSPRSPWGTNVPSPITHGEHVLGHSLGHPPSGI